MTRLENNWRHETLTFLEQVEWPGFNSDSRLIKRTKELRKVPLDTFTYEDLCFMIGQRIGLNYLVPLALECLSKDLLATGTLFRGELLENVLNIQTQFWDNNKEHWITLDELIKGRQSEVSERKIDLRQFNNSVHRV